MRPHEENFVGATAKNVPRKPARILPAPRVAVPKESNELLPSESRPRTYEGRNDDHLRKKKYQDDESKYRVKRDQDDDKDDRKGDQHDEKHSRKKDDKDDKKKGNTKADEKKKERDDEKTRKKKEDGDDMRQINVKEKKRRDVSDDRKKEKDDGKADEKKKERDDEKTRRKKDDGDDVRQINVKEKKQSQRDDDRKKEKDDGKPPTLNQVPQAGGTATTAHATPSAKPDSSSVERLLVIVLRKRKELVSLEDDKKANDTELAETIPGQIRMQEEEILERETKIQALKLQKKECMAKVEGKMDAIKKKRKDLLESTTTHAKAVVDNQKLEEHVEHLVTTRLQKKVSEEKPSSSSRKVSEEKPSSSSPDSEYTWTSEYSDEE